MISFIIQVFYICALTSLIVIAFENKQTVKRIVNVITYHAYKAISIIILIIPVLYIIHHDANCIHLEVYKINSDHLLYSAFCKILSIFTIFLAALLGYNSMRFAETEAEEKKMRTAISLVLTASSGMLAVDLTTLGNKVKFDDELLLAAIRNNHFVIDLSLHIFGMLLSCVACLALLNKDFRDYFFSDYDINQPLDQVRVEN